MTFGLVLPVFGYYRWKNFLSAGSLLLAILFFLLSHFKSDFSEDRQKPNSLVYYEDMDLGKAYWLTYDLLLDDWTRGYLGEDPEVASTYITNVAGSKYNTGYSFAKEAPSKEIHSFDVLLYTDTLIDSKRTVSFSLVPKRKLNQLILYTDTLTVFTSFKVNGIALEKDSLGQAGGKRGSRYLLGYSLSDSDSIKIDYTTAQQSPVTFTTMEYSYDLLDHPQFTINKRAKWMMPKPFVNTDAIVVKRSFTVDEFNLIDRDRLITETPETNE